MALDAAVERFRDWLTGEYRANAVFEGVRAVSGADLPKGDLSVRLDVGKRSYYEARVDLAEGVLQAGFATEGRVINEEIEQMVLDSGGDLSELLGDELSDLGEDALPMEHFFERPAFRYVVRLPLDGPGALDDPALRRRVRAVLTASHTLFQQVVDEA